MALVRTRTPETPLLVLARVDSFRVGGRPFSVVGGIEAESRLLDRLARAAGTWRCASYIPAWSSRLRSAPGSCVRFDCPTWISCAARGVALDTARFVITQSLGTLEALRRSVDRWFILAIALTIAVALALAAWLSSLHQPAAPGAGARRPQRSTWIGWTRASSSERRDEIGALSRLLGGMTDRLRNSSARLREAERRAAVGDLARQVNHDIKNGLAPIRNVLRHFSQVARQDPGLLPAVFEERRGTLDSSVEYLETLARNYARLSPAVERTRCDVNTVVEEVLRNTTADGTVLRTSLSPGLPRAPETPLCFDAYWRIWWATRWTAWYPAPVALSP